MNDPPEDDRPSRVTSRKADSYLYVVFSATVGFAAASIIMGTVIGFCLRRAETLTVPPWLVFVTAFVAALAGLLMGWRSWHRTKSDRGALPTQFTLRGLVAFTTASAALLGLLQWSEAAPWLWGAVIVFFSAVWTAQRFLFRGRHPWIASFLVGAAPGQLLWVWAWIAAADQAASYGTQVSTADLARDLFLAIVLGGSLGIAANLLLVWGFWMVALPSVLLSGLTSREGRQPIPPGSPPETTEERPKTTGDTAEGEPRRDDSVAARRGAILRAAAAVLLLAGAAMFQKAIRIGYYRHTAEYCYARFAEGKTPSPGEALLTSFSRFYPSWDSSEYLITYEECRDRLEELGYLEYRSFILKHMMTGTTDGDRALLWEAINQRFPDNIHTTVFSFDESGPLILQVWDRPSKIPKWEAFVREIDRPDFAENVAP